MLVTGWVGDSTFLAFTNKHVCYSEKERKKIQPHNAERFLCFIVSMSQLANLYYYGIEAIKQIKQD